MRCDYSCHCRCSRERIISADYRQTFRRNLKDGQAPPTSATCSSAGVKETIEPRQKTSNPWHSITLIKAVRLFLPHESSLPPLADLYRPLAGIHPHRCCLALLSDILIRTAQTPLRCSRIPQGSSWLCVWARLQHLYNTPQIMILFLLHSLSFKTWSGFVSPFSRLIAQIRP